MERKNGKYMNVAKISLLILIFGTVCFIFINSMLPPETSGNISDKVEDVITSVVPSDTEFGSFLTDYLRKIAHFTEYGLLGIELCVYVLLFEREKIKAALKTLPVPFAVGFIDESIQIASERGPSIKDVWIDVGGFITFSLLSYVIILSVGFVTRYVRRLIEKKTEKKDAGAEEK